MKYSTNYQVFRKLALKVFSALICVAALSIASAAQMNNNLREELLAMERSDQEARTKCSNGTADEQINCLAVIAGSIDAPNTKRLEAIYQKFGFPNAKLVGEDGLKAFLIVLQHCNSDALREKCLKPIANAFKRKEISPMDYANFTDRLRLHQGKPQVYGSGFETKDGKLVMSRTIDVKNLDKRRARIGLPPIAEYIKVLRELYHLDVVTP